MKYKIKVNGLKSDKKIFLEIVAPDRETLGHYFWDVVQYEIRSEEFVPATYEIIDITDEDAQNFVIEQESLEVEQALDYLADLPVSEFVEEMIEILVG